MGKILPSNLDVQNIYDFLDTLDRINSEKGNVIDEIHVDIMDGVFVENKCNKLDDVAIIKEKGYLADVHLMAENPIDLIDYAKRLGADCITIHYEIMNFEDYLNYLLEAKNNANLKIGVSLSPDTKIEALKPFLAQIDSVLIMSVYPGKGGQQFIQDSYNKIEELRNINDKIRIVVDGGINDTNIKKVLEKGADKVVIGSYITKDIESIDEKISKLINLI